MLDFNKFTEQLKFNVPIYLNNHYGVAYEDCNVIIQDTYKNNAKYTGLILVSNNDKNKISPVIPVENAYDYYLHTEDFEEILMKVSETFHMCMNDALIKQLNTEELVSKLSNPEILKSVVLPRFMNSNNTEYLEKLPNREYLEDINIVYTIDLDKLGFNCESMSIKVTDEILSLSGLTEADLYENAIKNLDKEDYIILPLSELVKTNYSHMIADEEEWMFDILENYEYPLYILSNPSLYAGSSMILSEVARDDLYERIGSDYYLIPSSLHEFLAVSINSDVSKEELLFLIPQINKSEIAKEDVLSDTLYVFSKQDNKIVLADDYFNEKEYDS